MGTDKQFYKEPWFFESVMDNIQTSVMVTDLDENIIYVNKASEKLFGYTKEEMVGRHPIFINAESDADNIQKDISNIITAGGIWYGQMNNRRKNGEIFIIDIKILPLKNEKDEVIAFIGFQMDVTDASNAQMSLKELAIELQQSNLELEQFAYVASHDLQEPLRVVSSYCQLLKENYYGCLDNDGKKYMNYTIDATLRMKTLIKELLDFSRVGRKDKPFEYVKVEDVLQEATVDYEMAITENKAKVIIEDELPVVYAIRFRMKQLLSNLLSNALKFHGNKAPLIRIGCCDEGNHWLFYVKDNGIGIEPQYFDRVFGIFKRLYSRDEYPGTGIGLALCKRIVETHGGKIWVDSEEHEGTWIYFTISKFIAVTDGT